MQSCPSHLVFYFVVRVTQYMFQCCCVCFGCLYIFLLFENRFLLLGYQANCLFSVSSLFQDRLNLLFTLKACQKLPNFNLLSRVRFHVKIKIYTNSKSGNQDGYWSHVHMVGRTACFPEFCRSLPQNKKDLSAFLLIRENSILVS